jgi:hypothetical protein
MITFTSDVTAMQRSIMILLLPSSCLANVWQFSAIKRLANQRLVLLYHWSVLSSSIGTLLSTAHHLASSQLLL